MVKPTRTLNAPFSGAERCDTFVAQNAPSSDKSEDDKAMVRALGKMGIRNFRPFDLKNRNFENWLECPEFYFFLLSA